MAKKGKVKISKVKRNNQTTNKMRKQGKLRLQRHRNKVQKQKQPTPSQEPVYSSDSDAASADEWADMLDEEEQKYIMGRIAKQPNLLSNVPEEVKKEQKKPKKRKRTNQDHTATDTALSSDSGAETETDNSDVEEKYETEMAERPAKRLRPLLPIKTKHGILERAEEYEDTDSDKDETGVSPDTAESKHEESQDADSDSGMEGTGEEGEGTDEVVTAVQLLAARRDKLNHEKLRIGALCSSLLENPEKKLKNLYPILYLMDEHLKDGTPNLVSVRKLAAVSAAEVFRDILPDYAIRHQDYSDVKLKKETLALYKYEKELLEFYKRYLQRMEKAASILRRKKGDSRQIDESAESLALVCLRCMCSLLVARPQFNFAGNIAQSVLPFLACSPQARALVTDCCAQVFADDNKGEITLKIVRLINQLVKKRGSRLHPSALDCLLALRIRDVDLDADADLKHKKRQEEKHKKRIVNLSKKEKKRAKKLKEVERELLETEARENSEARKKQLTEVTKTVFHIYFRILKTAPKSQLLEAVLSGLAKFSHVINVEYYSELVTLVSRLCADDALSARARLQCARAALAVLAAAGDALNFDPVHFHAHIYANSINVHAGGTADDARVVLEAVCQVAARARRVSPAVLQAFAKRLGTLALQLAPHAALAALQLLHNIIQSCSSVRSLLETEEQAGAGRYEAASPSPAHCGAHAAVLHELPALRRHYHPAARRAAAALLAGAPPFSKSPMHVYEEYDGSRMSFRPAVPPPQRAGRGGTRPAPHAWAQRDFKTHCEAVEDSVHLTINSFS